MELSDCGSGDTLNSQPIILSGKEGSIRTEMREAATKAKTTSSTVRLNDVNRRVSARKASSGNMAVRRQSRGFSKIKKTIPVSINTSTTPVRKGWNGTRFHQ